MQPTMTDKRKIDSTIAEETLLKAFELICTAKAMSELYEANKEVTAKYVHATSRGHEAIQLALGLPNNLPDLTIATNFSNDHSRSRKRCD